MARRGGENGRQKSRFHFMQYAWRYVIHDFLMHTFNCECTGFLFIAPFRCFGSHRACLHPNTFIKWFEWCSFWPTESDRQKTYLPRIKYAFYHCGGITPQKVNGVSVSYKIESFVDTVWFFFDNPTPRCWWVLSFIMSQKGWIERNDISKKRNLLQKTFTLTVYLFLPGYQNPT